MNPQTQQPPIDWTSGDHGVVLNDGTKIPYNQLQQTDPQLYSQYLEKVGQPQAGLQQTQTSTQATQAQIPGIQATSTKEQIAAKQAAAQQNLGNDLQNKMTLGSALKKYVSLGMGADDIFNRYLAQSPWGLPNENPQQLQNMGISAKALGGIGTPGSFMDRYNMKNAITGLRDLQDKWNQASTLSYIPLLGGFTTSGQAYHSARQIFGEHLSSLIPGASGAQSSVNDLLNTLPDTGDLASAEPGAAEGKFNAVETQLMAAKGYSHKDLGLPPRPATSQQPGSNTNATPAKGGDLLTSLLSNAGSDVKGIVDNAGQNKQFGVNSVNPADEGFIKNVLGIPGEYGQLLSNPIKHAQEHPVNTALDLLPLLGMVKGGAGGGPVAGADSGISIKDPGALQKIFSPGKIKEQAGGARDTVVNQATKGNNYINGNNIMSQLQNWADNQGKPGNPGQGGKIDMILKDAQNSYANKLITPSDAFKIYNEVDSGFNTKGLQKDAIQSRGDIALRGILRGELEKVAPGFDRLTNIIGQGYQAEKGAGAKIIKDLPKNAIRTGMNVAGLGFLRELIGP
jgi:hypothetical protein